MSTIAKRHASPHSGGASQRVNLRVTPQLKRLLVKAAEMQDLQLTDFVLNASRAAAEVTLANRTQFALPPGKWRAFNAALDEPPREIAALRRLFSEKSVFDGA